MFELRLMNCDPRVAVQKQETRKTKKKHIKTLEKTDKEMKTNLPTTICLIDFFTFFLECLYGFT